MSESELCRPLRTGVFTLVCASLSAVGHVVSSGHDVPLVGLLLGTAVVLAVAWVLSGRRHGPGMLTAWMLWGQLALHVTFSYTQAANHVDHTGAVLVQDPMPAWAMISMHLVMALVSAWWLHLGENALFAFLRFMALSLIPLLLVVGAVPSARVTASVRFATADQRPRTRPPYLRHSRVLRGPPPVLAA
ncbi:MULTISPECIES: hypothetical protein [unclassified Nocardiopsis]|uniref:hypothetical protein n=1 Tax=unclassified Nocardiopsis TaxID=2649073 RepID=UPI000A48E70C|nr:MULTISPECIES: hypothetical protein [unclassified Nocardiopsis]MBQ1084485.1 hypothetical protein [Nocardiopsis sp. B62]